MDKLHNTLYQIMFCDRTTQDTGKACRMHGRDEKFMSRNLKSTGNCGISGKMALYCSSVKNVERIRMAHEWAE
jgi:hypothetical protein